MTRINQKESSITDVSVSEKKILDRRGKEANASESKASFAGVPK